MIHSVLPCIFLLNFCMFTGYSANNPRHYESCGSAAAQPDTLAENQILYNGREWRNLYYKVEGDQFFLSREFLSGKLTIQGRTFSNIRIKYDLYKDEILTPLGGGEILQLNKEMVDSFSIYFQNRSYRFVRIPEDTFENMEGYVQAIYEGKTALYVKYIKKIDRPAVENEYDKFYQISRIYFVRDNLAYLITNISDLFRHLADDKAQIKDFIRKNQLRLSKKVPESFVPVIGYLDNINQ